MQLVQGEPVLVKRPVQLTGLFEHQAAGVALRVGGRSRKQQEGD
jgi:hypothetical protein